MKTNNPPVTTIIPTFNSSTTIVECLSSLKSQNYPIAKVIIVDGGSKDDTVEKIKLFKKKNKAFNVELLRPLKKTSVGHSYNLGINKAKTELVVALHSDSVLKTNQELKKLVDPIIKDDSVVATYPTVVNPKKVWNTYSFWLKCHFSRWAGASTPSMNGKFDCYQRKIFKKIGGHDTKTFQDRIGAEDVNLSQRLRKEGRVVLSKARVLHLHYMGKGYTFRKWMEYRKILSITYGKVIGKHWMDLKAEVLIFLIKPVIAVGTLIPVVNFIFIPILLLFSIYYMKPVYFDPVSRKDWRIFILPFAIMFLVYYETYWTVRGLIFNRRQV